MTRANLVLAAIIVVLVIGSVGCGGPSGCATQSPGAGGATSGGTGGGSSPPASGCIVTSTGSTATTGIYLMVANAGGIQGEFADTTTKKMSITPNFGTVSVDTAVPGDWLVIAQQKYMYGGYANTGQIYMWSVSGAGLLTALNPPNITASFLSNTSIVGTNLGTANAGWQGMITNPAGTLLFVVDQTPGSGAVEVYQIGTSGLLTGPTKTLLPSGFVPFNLAIDGQGKYLYVSDINVADNLTDSMMAYSFDASGNLTPVPNSPFPSQIQQMQGEATGAYMIGTGGGLFLQSELFVAAIQSDGELTVTPTTVSGVPTEVTVQPNSGGNLVYAVDFPQASTSGVLEGFTFDVSTGALTEMTGSPFTSVLGAHGEFDTSGQFFFFSSSTNAAAVALYSYDVTAYPDLSTDMASTGWAPGAWVPLDSH